ncbi:MAG: HEAT repeat domain-containing protein [Proteobacteria bacterium]|nr:HEAT repeat domain-containing protein [Pseudomonadota bacterium]
MAKSSKKTSFRVEVIPNMYEIGIFKKTLSSRTRLRVTAACAIAALCLCYLGAGMFIRYISTWSLLNIAIIILIYIATLVVGYLLALLIGDIIFAGPWLKKMHLGDSYTPDDIEDQKALLKNKNIYFIFVWLISIIALGFGCDICTGSNIRWYQNIGGIVISMRSTDPTERAAVIRTISNPYHSSKWQDPEIREGLMNCIRDEDDNVRAWAAYLAGKAKISESASDLMDILRSDNFDPISRQEAAIALARLEWKQARGSLLTVMRATFERNHADTVLVPATLFAFYILDDPMAYREALSILDTCLEARDCSPQVLQYAFFYLKSMKKTETAALAFKYLDTPDISQEMRCYATDVLRFTATKNDVPAMKQAFENTPIHAECPVIYRKYHEEAAIILFEHETMRALLVRAIGNIMDAANYDWIYAIGANTSENAQTRKIAETYIRSMNQKNIK